MAECSDLSKIQISICEKSDDISAVDDITKSITNDIVCVLQLEDNENKDQIVNDLLESGRQSLVKYQNDIILEIYTAEMDGDTGKLINLLKKYFQQQWEAQYSTSKQWFISFLKQYQNGEKHDLYELVLTRTAEYGNEYMKDCPILSIVLQLLFEGIHDQCLKETNVFNELWFRITTDGIESITNDDEKSTTKFSDYIIDDVMNEQKTNKQSTLFLALRVYYDEPVSLLLKKSNVRVNDDVKNTALEKIAEHGLLKGAEVIQPKTTRNLYAKLKENIHFYLKEQKEKYLARTRVIDSSSSSANVQAGSILTDKVTTSNEKQDENMSSAPSNNSILNVNKMEHVLAEHQMKIDDTAIVQISEWINEQDGTVVTRNAITYPTTSPNSEPTTTPVLSIENGNDERNIVLSCIRTQSDLFQLENLVQAGELQYMSQTLKDISEKLVDDFHRKHRAFSEFIQDCLTPIMYFLKRLQNLDDFMNTLTFKYQRIRRKANFQSTETTNLSLRMLLYILFINSDIFLRRIIMSLVSKRNPVPFVSPNIENTNEQYEFIPAIIHVWDYKRPTILSFGIGPCKGKSTLLNELFRSTFEQTVDSIYFQQTIDIDFGYCFNPERPLNIADTHGMIDKNLLRKIQPLFDGFLIQIDKIYVEKQPKILLEYIDILPRDKFQMVIIRDTPNQSLQDCSSQIKTILNQSELDLSHQIHIYPLINISNTNDRNITFAIEDLREEILTKIIEEISITTERKNEILPNLQKLARRDYVEYLKKLDKIIQPLKKRLLQKNEYQNEQNFPLYLKFQELCKVRQKLKKLDFYGSESKNMFDINARLFELESELDPHTKTSSPIKCGYVFDSFIEILKSDNMLMSLDLLASELKSELSSLGGDKLAGNLVVEHAFLSLEVLWRNSIVCYDHVTNDTQNTITKSYHDFVAAGFPFEIIDGDNFHFQHQFLTKILDKFASKRILVISIIGPQNSGKSTLLNYMFGTLFDVREGRCTRGIYGSLVKLIKTNQIGKNTLGKVNTEIPDIDYIMLIDTEGLLGIEKGDKEYDRRLVLFCLAVSHLVIVNMMGDINETLKDMLTLCADSLKQIGVNTVNQPIVHFVLNQKADPNLNNHMQAIEKIIEDLREKELAEVIDISSKTFHTLPSAFRKERISIDTKSPCFLRTEPDFIERTQQLCEKIIESAKLSYGRSGDMFSNPSQWLKTAVNVFDTLQKFPDLTYFKDINERRQDDQIRKEIGDLMAKTLSAAYRAEMIKNTCELTEHEIRNHFQATFDVHQNNFDNYLENIFKVTNASDRIRDRCRQFLKRQVTEFSNAWCTAAIQAHDQKQMEGLVKDGSAELRKLIDDIIQSGKTMTKEEARREFENMWKKKIESINDNFNPEERLKQAIKFVYGNYHIFEKNCLPSHEHILNYLTLIIEWSKKSGMGDVARSIQTQLDNKTSQLQQNTVEVHWTPSDTHIPYTLATLHNFEYLNKDQLSNLCTVSTMDQESFDMETESQTMPIKYSHGRETTKSSSSNLIKRAYHAAKNYVVPRKPITTANLASLRFDFIDTVHHTILREMQNTPNEKSNILCIQTLFNKILQKTINIVHVNDRIRRPIEIDLVQKIVSLINTIFNKVNHELIVFKLSLSKQTKSYIHTFILILLTIFYYGEQKNHFDQQLKTLTEQKSSLLTYFISMVVPDSQCDKEGAVLFANQIKNAIQSNLKRDATKIIARNAQSQQNLNRKHIQTVCDGKLYAAANNDDWLLRYINAPTEIIVEEFEILWKEIEKTINHELETEKNHRRNVLTEFFNRIDSMISSLANEGAAVQYIDDIFEASDGKAADNLKNKGQCMVLLLHDYLSGAKIQSGTSYKVFDKYYTIKPKGLKLFEKLREPSQQLANLIQGMKNVNNSTVNPMTVASITNLQLFLQGIMDVKSEVEFAYNKSPSTFVAFDKDQIYNKLLDKARGCTSKCPCCQRPCDVDHTLIKSNAGDEYNRHACQTGHQLRAMAGIKFEVSDEASLFQCEQMEDDKPIIVRGTKKKWSEFKKDYPDWDFGNSITPDELFKLRGKFLNVWSRIGKHLCQEYNMKFVTENTPQPAPRSFHYILLLDASGSMNGEPWSDLLNGVKEFINIRVNSGSTDRITIVTFDHNATYAYINADIKTIDITKIQFTNGATDFGKAFDLVIQIMQYLQLQISTSNSAGNLDFIIVFMSDGQAEYPSTQLETLLTMKTKIHQFWTVALGQTKMDILEQINLKMQGTFTELKNSADLVQVYAEIARN